MELTFNIHNKRIKLNKDFKHIVAEKIVGSLIVAIIFVVSIPLQIAGWRWTRTKEK